MPTDHSRDAEVSLQGIDYKYESVCTQSAIDNHKVEMEVQKAKADALEEAKRKLVEEKKAAIAAKFEPVIEKSMSIWPIVEPSVVLASSLCFNAIADHLQKDFICAGSYPASIIATEMRNFLNDASVPLLKYNDIDIYWGTFTKKVCAMERLDCKYSKITPITSEINFIQCENLNETSLIENFDINAVSLCVRVSVAASTVTAVEWFISPAFWHFILEDHTLRSWSTDSPSRTLVRLAHKSYQMGLSFDSSSLAITEGELFSSHKRKIEEMESGWEKYPFSDYKLKVKTKKSFMFVRERAECPCGRKANLKCRYINRSTCCKARAGEC